MNQKERVVDLFLLPVLLLLGGLVALRLENDLSRRLMLPDSPYEKAEMPRTDEADPPLSERVVLVLIEDFKLDATTAVELDVLRDFVDHGAHATLSAALPVDVLPGTVSMLTGANREIHGVVAGFSRPVPDLLERIDSLPAAAARIGRPVRYFCSAEGDSAEAPKAGETRDGWEVLGPVAQWNAAEPGEVASSFASRTAQGSALDLVRLKAPSVEVRSNSRFYRKARRDSATAVNGWIQAVVDAVDLDREAVVLSFFESHLPAEGQAARFTRPQPTVLLAGAGVRGSTVARGRQQDIAPTLAVLLGLAMPAANAGDPILSILDVDEEQAGAAIARTSNQKERFLAHCAERFRLGDPERIASAPGAVLESRARQYRTVVTPQIAMGGFLAIALLLLVPQFQRVSTVLTGAAAGGVLLMLYVVLRGTSFDLLSFTARGGYSNFASGILLYGLILWVLGAIAAVVLIPRAKRRLPSLFAQRSLLLGFGGFVVLWAVATLSWVRFDMPASGTPELNRWTLTYATALLLLIVVSFGSLPAALLAGLRARLAFDPASESSAS